MKKPGPRSLPLSEWPAADRAAWKLALTPAVRLQRGGPASHFATVSREDHERRYGAYLGFLARSGSLDRGKAAASLVTRSDLARYLVELERRVRSATIYNCIHKLRRVAEILSPAMDFSWLVEIERDLKIKIEPRSKFNRVVLTPRLVKAGFTLMEQARAMPRSVERARVYRNGLMISLLALCPIRLKNFAQLDIGSTFRSIEKSWWIVLSTDHTKSRRADERKIPDFLTPSVDEYLATERPHLIKGGAVDALWVSSTTGMRLTAKNLGSLISRLTKRELGIDVSPHLFRTAAASTAALGLSASPGLAAGLLGHVDSQVTELHYNRAKTSDAVVSFSEIISKLVAQRPA